LRYVRVITTATCHSEWETVEPRPLPQVDGLNICAEPRQIEVLERERVAFRSNITNENDFVWHVDSSDGARVGPGNVRHLRAQNTEAYDRNLIEDWTLYCRDGKCGIQLR